MKVLRTFCLSICLVAIAGCDQGEKPKTTGDTSGVAAKPKAAKKVNPADFFKAVSDNEVSKVKEMVAKDPSLAKSTDNDLKETALAAASFSGNKELVELLIKAGSDVNARDSFGVTPLIGPARTGHPEIVKMLLKAKAAVNQTTNAGETALHYAARYKQADVAKILLANGADRNLKDKGGKTALDAAKEELKKDSKYQAVVDVLSKK